MTEAKRRARSNAVHALTLAWMEVREYLDKHATPNERSWLVGLEPDLHELGRRFEYETKEEG